MIGIGTFWNIDLLTVEIQVCLPTDSPRLLLMVRLNLHYHNAT